MNSENIGLAAEVTREMWGGRWLADFVAGCPVRSANAPQESWIHHRRGAALALGIGANTAIFS